MGFSRGFVVVIKHTLRFVHNLDPHVLSVWIGFVLRRRTFGNRDGHARFFFARHAGSTRPRVDYVPTAAGVLGTTLTRAQLAPRCSLVAKLDAELAPRAFDRYAAKQAEARFVRAERERAERAAAVRRAERRKSDKAKERDAAKAARVSALREFAGDRKDAQDRETRRRNSMRQAAEAEARRLAEEEAAALERARALLEKAQVGDDDGGGGEDGEGGGVAGGDDGGGESEGGEDEEAEMYE